ncbi:hypothetical protein N9954_01355 [Maribacter sp.]|nr:hypothetical protein [Maribacter sp.]
MKTLNNTGIMLLLALIFGFQASFGQNKGNSISFTTFNHQAEIDKGIWFATNENENVCLQLMDAINRNNSSFIIGFCIPAAEFTVNGTEGFELRKPAGTISFQGSFPNEKGQGDFTFVKNRDFQTFLKKEGIDTTDENSSYYFKLFLGTVSKDYVLGVKKQGYQPTIKQLGKLAIHHVDLQYIKAIAATNYKGLSLDMLIKFAIHDISVDYIKDLERVGYGDMDANMIKKFAIHDVDIDYIEGLTELGYGNLDPNMIKNFAVHDISLDYIRGLSDVGFSNLDPGMLKKFAVHDISPNYIKSIRDTGINDPDASTFKKAKVHGLTANYIKRAKADGHDSNELSDYIRLKIKGK